MRNPERILIRAPNWIGDSVISTAAVKAVKEHYRDASIVIAARNWLKDIWLENPYISGIINCDLNFERILLLRKQRFDLGIIFPSSLSSAWFMFLSGAKERVGYENPVRNFLLTKPISHPKRDKHLIEEYFDILRSIGITPKDKELIVRLSPYDEARADVLLIAKGIKKNDELIGICPGATYGPAKRWLPDRFVELSKKLIEKHGIKIVLFGNNSEAVLLSSLANEIGKEALYFAGNTSIKITTSLIKRCKLIVTNDTGPMHLAASMHVPILAIFGSTSPAWTAPLGKEHFIVYKALSCSPCFKRSCPKGDYACFKEISVDEVMHEVNRILVTLDI